MTCLFLPLFPLSYFQSPCQAKKEEPKGTEPSKQLPAATMQAAGETGQGKQSSGSSWWGSAKFQLTTDKREVLSSQAQFSQSLPRKPCLGLTPLCPFSWVPMIFLSVSLTLSGQVEAWWSTSQDTGWWWSYYNLSNRLSLSAPRTAQFTSTHIHTQAI